MGRDKANKPRRPRDLGPVPERHVEAVPGVMVTLTGPSTVTAAAAHERMEKGPEALADYVRTGSQWQVTVMGRGAPERTHARVTEIPSMSEALRMALVVADRMFPPGTALLHTVAGDAETWMPTYLSEHGSLPRQGGWTAVAGGDGPTHSYVPVGDPAMAACRQTNE
ncbi:hypothetical protein [Streptomyces sp. NPDC048473]|uniref:hypothetical protein n=1 Tax=unclassified Streptomyces TaxID=2593676 RepID=UPI0037199A4D